MPAHYDVFIFHIRCAYFWCKVGANRTQWNEFQLLRCSPSSQFFCKDSIFYWNSKQIVRYFTAVTHFFFALPQYYRLLRCKYNTLYLLWRATNTLRSANGLSPRNVVRRFNSSKGISKSNFAIHSSAKELDTTFTPVKSRTCLVIFLCSISTVIHNLIGVISNQDTQHLLRYSHNTAGRWVRSASTRHRFDETVPLSCMSCHTR